MLLLDLDFESKKVWFSFITSSPFKFTDTLPVNMKLLWMGFM